MLRLLPLKYLIFCTALISFILIAFSFAAGEIFSREKEAVLRIVYSGGLNGNIEPCG